ncbi:hypothetical protein, partial [Nocardia sp. NPDC019255]|uniref:hypothetical protein n=1 Tax=Nocardia sp. NPDC019255 TaxID=3154591 RepID=UPI0033FD7C73
SALNEVVADAVAIHRCAGGEITDAGADASRAANGACSVSLRSKDVVAVRWARQRSGSDLGRAMPPASRTARVLASLEVEGWARRVGIGVVAPPRCAPGSVGFPAPDTVCSWSMLVPTSPGRWG